MLLDGYAMRTPINKPQLEKFILKLFEDIELNPELNERFYRIFKIINTAELLSKFNCGTENLLVVETEGQLILSRVFENYFTMNFTESSVSICEKVVEMHTPRNMLNIMLYIAEELYSDIS